jgi:Bacterial HORMA domain family 1
MANDSWLYFPGSVMTSTITETRTFTINHARYVASKIAADLDLLRAYHGKPPEQHVTDLAGEAALILAARYLKSVEYGFRRNGLTILALKYVARSDGTLTSDDRPGRVHAEANLDDARWYSFLEYNEAFLNLPQADRDRFEATLPIQRQGAPAPQAGIDGYWEQTRTYSSNGEGVLRHMFRPR